MRKNLIFDASSTYIMIKGKDLESLRDSSTLDLAFYEIGNAVLQESRMEIIDQRASAAIAQVLQNLAGIMNVVPFGNLNAENVLKIARQARLTFYDASYIELAKSNKEALTTDDSPLDIAARRKGIKTYSARNHPTRSKKA